MVLQRPRPVALCLFWRGEAILVREHFQATPPHRYYRPVGGTVEYGEPSSVAAEREVEEELGVPVEGVNLLAVLEHIFLVGERQGHEIIFIYEAKFVDLSLYEQPWLPGVEANGDRFRALWKRLEDFDDEAGPLHPEGLLPLLRELAG